MSVFLGMDVSEFETGLKKAEKKLTRFGKDMSKIGSRLTLGLSVPLAGLGVSFIKAASELEETRSKFNAVFKDLSKETEAWANTQAVALNRGSGDLMKYLATLQDTFVPLGFARDQAADMSKQLTQLAIDLASFNNMADEDAIRALQSGIIGNTETLRQFGVIITQATLSQELLNMGITGGAKAATEAQKAQARLNIVMQSTTDAQGDALRTADGFANSMRGLQARAGDVAESFGAFLLPIVTKLVQKFSAMAASVANLSNETKAYILIAGGFASVLGPAVYAFGQLAIVLPKVITSIRALNTTLALTRLKLAGIVGLVLAAGVAIKSFFDALGMNIIRVLTEALELFAEGIADFVGWISSLFPSLGIAEKIEKYVAAPLRDVFNELGITEFAKKYADAFKANLSALAGPIRELNAYLVEQLDPAEGASSGSGSTPAATGGTGGGSVSTGDPIEAIETMKPKLQVAREGIKTETEKIATDFKTMSSEIGTSLQSLDGFLESFGSKFGSIMANIVTKSEGTKELFKAVIFDFIDLIIQQAVIAIAGGEAVNKSFAGIGAVGFAGAAAAAAGSFFKGLVSARFATGGMVNEPTAALMGDYAGAQQNPEYALRQDQLEGLVSGGGGGQALQAKLTGEDLLIWIDRAQNTNTDLLG